MRPLERAQEKLHRAFADAPAHGAAGAAVKLALYLSGENIGERESNSSFPLQAREQEALIAVYRHFAESSGFDPLAEWYRRNSPALCAL